MEHLDLRVSDSDRAQALVRLREAMASGRLTLDEFSERVDLVHAARSERDLRQALRGLPVTRTAMPFRFHLLLYVVVNAALVLTWLVTRPDSPRPEDEGFGTSFWPIWPIVIWGALLLTLGLRTLGRRGRRRELGP